jgi:hypothetical protein
MYKCVSGLQEEGKQSELVAGDKKPLIRLPSLYLTNYRKFCYLKGKKE